MELSLAGVEAAAAVGIVLEAQVAAWAKTNPLLIMAAVEEEAVGQTHPTTQQGALAVLRLGSTVVALFRPKQVALGLRRRLAAAALDRSLVVVFAPLQTARVPLVALVAHGVQLVQQAYQALVGAALAARQDKPCLEIQT